MILRLSYDDLRKIGSACRGDDFILTGARFLEDECIQLSAMVNLAAVSKKPGLTEVLLDFNIGLESEQILVIELQQIHFSEAKQLVNPLLKMKGIRKKLFKLAAKQIDLPGLFVDAGRQAFIIHPTPLLRNLKNPLLKGLATNHTLKINSLRLDSLGIFLETKLG